MFFPWTVCWDIPNSALCRLGIRERMPFNRRWLVGGEFLAALPSAARWTSHPHYSSPTPRPHIGSSRWYLPTVHMQDVHLYSLMRVPMRVRMLSSLLVNSLHITLLKNIPLGGHAGAGSQRFCWRCKWTYLLPAAEGWCAWSRCYCFLGGWLRGGSVGWRCPRWRYMPDGLGRGLHVRVRFELKKNVDLYDVNKSSACYRKTRWKKKKKEWWSYIVTVVDEFLQQFGTKFNAMQQSCTQGSWHSCAKAVYYIFNFFLWNVKFGLRISFLPVFFFFLAFGLIVCFVVGK